MKQLKLAGLITFQILLCAIFFELFGYFFLVKSSNPLYRARRILHFDERLGWKQKPNLSTTFENQPVMTDEQGYRISGIRNSVPLLLTLGPSSAFGWGVSDEETYSALVAKKTGGLLNASGIGHSLYQGKILWNEKLKHLRPSHILIAYGVNDLDKFRFFDSESSRDSVYFQTPLRKSYLDKFDSHFLNVLSLAKNLASYQISCSHITDTAIRVPWNEFSTILKELTDDMKEKGIVPILIGTPFYLKNPRAGFTVNLIEDAYEAASGLAREGKCKEAHEALTIAKSYEPENILEQVKIFNKNLEIFARENDLRFIDAFKTISVEKAETNFYDPVHPSAEGHKKIASQILKSMFN